MSYSNKNTKKYLLIFDFDQTIVDQDSEVELLNLIFSKELYDQIMKEIYNYDFFEGFNYYFRIMKDMGLTLKDIDSNLEKLELSPKMVDLFDYLKKNKKKYEIVILSSCIDYSIKKVLKHYGFSDLIDDYLCTKAYIEEEKSNKLLYVPKNQFPHSCKICSPSQCKSVELEKFLNKKYKKYEKLLFVCDGENDFCPSKKVLKEGDIVFPRVEHNLINKLKEKKFRDQIICKVHPWKTADEIILELKKL